MRTYLMLKERAAAFRADPRWSRRCGLPACPSWTTPTLAAGETWQDLLADRSAYEDYDPELARARGVGAVRLEQLVVEDLLGRR